MKKMILAVCAALALATTAQAAEGKKFSEKQLAQQQVMKDCNAEAKTKALKGADRKAFMKSCLSGDKAAAATPATPATPAMPATAAKPAMPATPATPAMPATAAKPAMPATPATPAAADKAGAQKEKMKACNAEAKTKALKGDDRKKFMSSCLSAG